MKIAITFAFLVVGITALPEPEEFSIDIRNERIVAGSIVKAIDAVSLSISDAGLAPYYLEKKQFSYALPVPTIFNTSLYVEEVLFSGLSHIVVHRINYAVVTSRLTFDIEMPLIHLNVGAASAEAILFGRKFDIKASGKVDLLSIRIGGQIRINVNVLTGISIRSINITFAVGGIDAEVCLIIQGKDYSDNMNTFLNSTVPKILKEHSAAINELIEIVLLNLINSNLK